MGTLKCGELVRADELEVVASIGASMAKSASAAFLDLKKSSLDRVQLQAARDAALGLIERGLHIADMAFRVQAELEKRERAAQLNSKK